MNWVNMTHAVCIYRYFILDTQNTYTAAWKIGKLIKLKSSPQRRKEKKITGMKKVHVQYPAHPIKLLPTECILVTRTKVLIKLCQMFVIEKTQAHTHAHTHTPACSIRPNTA